MKELECNSCKKSQINSTGCAVFKCPQCSTYEIVRCKQCRDTAIQYTCPECSFVGPA